MADEVEGKVEGRDGGDDAAGHPQGEAEFAGAVGSRVQGQGFAIESLGLFGGQGDGLLGPGCLAHTFADDFAFLGGNRTPQFFKAFGHQLGGLVENFVTLVGGHGAHDLGTALGRGYGRFYILGIPSGDGVDHGAVKGIVNIDFFVFVDPVAANKHFHSVFLE